VTPRGTTCGTRRTHGSRFPCRDLLAPAAFARPCPLRARSDGDQRGVAEAHGHSTGICPGRRFPCSEVMILKDFPS
jgi:hypothetical protein